MIHLTCCKCFSFCACTTIVACSMLKFMHWSFCSIRVPWYSSYTISRAVYNIYLSFLPNNINSNSFIYCLLMVHFIPQNNSQHHYKKYCINLEIWHECQQNLLSVMTMHAMHHTHVYETHNNDSQHWSYKCPDGKCTITWRQPTTTEDRYM